MRTYNRQLKGALFLAGCSTQREASFRTGISQTKLSNILGGLTLPNERELLALEALVGKKVIRASGLKARAARPCNKRHEQQQETPAV